MTCVDNYVGCKYQHDDECTECETNFYLTGKDTKRCC